MIKTIQITAVMLAVLAIAALVGAVFLGIRPDPAKSETLSLPSIVEEFKKTAAASPTQTKTSPLVAQAQSFTKRINPPPPPKPVEKNGEESSGAAAGSKLPPPPPPANFEVIATAVNPVDPLKSYALLSQPGKGFFWVKPNDEVSRAVIKQILPGKIVTTDGREYSIIRIQRISLLKPGSPLPPGYEDHSLSSSPTIGQPAAPTASTARTISSTAAVERSATVAEPDVAPAPPSAEDVKASVEWLRAAMDNPESIGLTKEEAAQLGNLGQMLEDMTAGDAESRTQAQDPNAAPAGGSEGE